MFHALVPSWILCQNCDSARQFRRRQTWISAAERREEIGERIDSEGVHAPTEKRADIRELAHGTGTRNGAAVKTCLFVEQK